MSNMKNRSGDFAETRHALAEYVDSMLRQPSAGSGAGPQPSVSADDVNHNEPEDSLVSSRMLSIRLDGQQLYIPVAQVKSVLFINDRILTHGNEPATPLLGMVNREGLDIPLYDLGWVCSTGASGYGQTVPGKRAQAVILRGRHIALACDSIADMAEINPNQILPSRDQRPSRRWIQGIVMTGMIPVINIQVIKEIFRTCT
jgi:chemotaxis signal transduction protein